MLKLIEWLLNDSLAFAELCDWLVRRMQRYLTNQCEGDRFFSANQMQNQSGLITCL